MTKAIEMRGITAIIHRNFRDIDSQPKVLLTDIDGIDRDHMWIEITNDIMKFIPRSNRRTNKVQFDCKLREYVTHRLGSVITKLGATNLQNIHSL